MKWQFRHYGRFEFELKVLVGLVVLFLFLCAVGVAIDKRTGLPKEDGLRCTCPCGECEGYEVIQ